MMMNTSTKTQPGGKGHRPFPGAVALAALAAVSLAACDFDRVLDVPDPDVVLPDLTRSETALPSWRAATLGDFAVAYSGNGGSEGQILTSGLLADEFYHSGTFPTRREIDERNIRIENATTQGVFRNLQRARNTAEEASTVYEEFGPDQAGRAEVLSLAGFTYVMFGENYCSGVPFSRFDLQTGEIEYGEPLDTDAMFERAADFFGAATGIAGAGGDLQQLAAVGLGRALLNQGRFQEAAAAVADVDTDFEYVIFHSDNTARQNNGVWSFNNSQRRWSVANRDGGTGLPYLDDADDDPRLAYTGPAAGFEASIPAYFQQKYPLRTSNVPVANGVEARLIEAEAALQRDDPVTFAQRHTELRARIGLGAVSIDGLSEADLVDLHFQERAYWMWLTAHRLGDMRRLIRQYGRDQTTVFPQKGAGTDVNFPVPVDELNNPLFSGCFDRDA
jgi:starch-binding outer membrane protein, SusD/RagB family